MVRDVAIHTVRREEETDVRVLIRPRIAVRLDNAPAAGAPARVREITCKLNGRQVVGVEAGPSLNDESYFEFTLNGAQAGDRLEVAWVDSAGAKGAGRLTLK